jgi:hypothetical protein
MLDKGGPITGMTAASNQGHGQRASRASSVGSSAQPWFHIDTLRALVEQHSTALGPLVPLFGPR